MKRKVVKLGPSTLVISLPKKWTNQQNIGSSSEVEVIEQGRNLLVQSDGAPEIKQSTIDLSKHKNILKRIVAGKYLSGDDEITIRVDSLAKSRLIQKRVHEMIGMEVIEQGKDFLKLKDMGSSSDDFEVIFKRILHLLHTISNEITNNIQECDSEMDYLEDMEFNLNIFTDYAQRLLNKKGHPQPHKTATMHTIVFLLEDIGDQYKSIANQLNHSKKLTKEEIELFKECNKLYQNVESLLMQPERNKAEAIANLRDKLIKKLNNKTEIQFRLRELIETNTKIMGQMLTLIE